MRVNYPSAPVDKVCLRHLICFYGNDGKINLTSTNDIEPSLLQRSVFKLTFYNKENVRCLEKNQYITVSPTILFAKDDVVYFGKNTSENVLFDDAEKTGAPFLSFCSLVYECKVIDVIDRKSDIEIYAEIVNTSVPESAADGDCINVAKAFTITDIMMNGDWDTSRASFPANNKVTNIVDLSKELEKQNAEITSTKQGNDEYNGFQYKHIDDGIEIVKYCEKNIKELTVPSQINGCPVVRIGGMAFFSASVEEVILPDSITSIGYNAFSYCWHLRSLRLPAKLQEIEGAAFSNCYQLREVDFPKALERIGDSAFENCLLLSEIALPASLSKLGNSCFENTILKSVTIPGSVKTISERCFANNHLLSKVIITEGVEEICEKAFVDTNVEELIIPSSVRRIERSVIDPYSSNLKVRILLLGNKTLIDCNRWFRINSDDRGYSFPPNAEIYKPLEPKFLEGRNRSDHPITKLIREEFVIYVIQPTRDPYYRQGHHDLWLIKRDNDEFITVRINSIYKRWNEKPERASLRINVRTQNPKDAHYYVFYSEWTDTMWVMSSEEFIQESSADRWGREYTIALNELSESSDNGDKIVQNVEKYQRYICTDFSRLHVVES